MNTDTEHVVQEATQRLPSTTNVAVELCSIDIEEEEEVELFISTGCSCSTNCSSKFSREYIREMRSSCFSLTCDELDMATLGQLMASSNISDTVEVSSWHLQKERPHTTYYHCGKNMCHKTYCFLHTWSHTTCTWEYTMEAKTYPINAINKVCGPISPHLFRAECFTSAEEHLQIVQLDRSFYRSTCDDCRREVSARFSSNGSFHPPPLSAKIPANSNNIKVHYSFDYAQQVHFPSDPLQPGPIYFLTPRKCTVFGINCEAIPRHLNFLTDEAGERSKGANYVISRLHYFFEMHGLGEKVVYLHADNCTGQNKNNCMIHYLVWRALTNRHSSLTLSFFIVGHTKFSPDWCFGLFKRCYCRTKVGSLTSIAQVVNDAAECNFTQLVTCEDGSTIPLCLPTIGQTSLHSI